MRLLPAKESRSASRIITRTTHLIFNGRENEWEEFLVRACGTRVGTRAQCTRVAPPPSPSHPWGLLVFPPGGHEQGESCIGCRRHGPVSRRRPPAQLAGPDSAFSRFASVRV
jgi:hypothetical protein